MRAKLDTSLMLCIGFQKRVRLAATAAAAAAVGRQGGIETGIGGNKMLAHLRVGSEEIIPHQLTLGR